MGDAAVVNLLLIRFKSGGQPVEIEHYSQDAFKISRLCLTVRVDTGVNKAECWERAVVCD